MRFRNISCSVTPLLLLLMIAAGCGDDAPEQRVYIERTYIQMQEAAPSGAAVSAPEATPSDEPSDGIGAH